MSNAQPDERDEKPLDPEVERLRRRMVRLLAVSIGIMLVAVMTVLAAVVYKVAQPAGEVELADADALSAGWGQGDAPLEARAALPDGFSVEDVSLDGARILFFGRMPQGGTRAFVFDIFESRIVADIGLAD